MSEVVAEFLDTLEDMNTIYHAQSNHEFILELSNGEELRRYHVILQETGVRQVKIQDEAFSKDEFRSWLNREIRVCQLP